MTGVGLSRLHHTLLQYLDTFCNRVEQCWKNSNPLEIPAEFTFMERPRSK